MPLLSDYYNQPVPDPYGRTPTQNMPPGQVPSFDLSQGLLNKQQPLSAGNAVLGGWRQPGFALQGQFGQQPLNQWLAQNREGIDFSNPNAVPEEEAPAPASSSDFNYTAEDLASLSYFREPAFYQGADNPFTQKLSAKLQKQGVRAWEIPAMAEDYRIQSAAVE